MTLQTDKVLGHVHDVVEPVHRLRADGQFVGFIVSERSEKIFFHSNDLRCRRPLRADDLKNRVVVFDAVAQERHTMRKAVNIDLLSGAER